VDMARNSFVALAPDTSNDGLLTVGEVVDSLSLSGIELVTLSACMTGLGNLNEAEGTVGFQRALLAKGVRSALVSLWSVPSRATSMLMEQFYRHWIGDENGPGKSEALRRAQEYVRSQEEFRDPRYWAGFQLVGAP
jgi:CHAT domain-containing protein